jgi:RNA polymerase sigma-70 factor (ECF subfamily)
VSSRISDAVFSSSVNRLRDALVTWTAHRVGDRDTAEDVVQDALTKAYLRRDSFAGHGTIDAWIWRCCARECLQWLRHDRRARMRSRAVSSDLAANIASALQADAIAERAGYSAQDRDNTVWDALVALPKQQFLVTCYRLVFAHSTHEVATYLRVSEGTVKATLSAAKRKMRLALADQITRPASRTPAPAPRTVPARER